MEVSAPLNIYPEYKPTRSLFAAKGVDTITVEVTTDKGIIGYGDGGPGGGPIVMGHLTQLMMGRDPSTSNATGTSTGAPPNPMARRASP